MPEAVCVALSLCVLSRGSELPEKLGFSAFGRSKNSSSKGKQGVWWYFVHALWSPGAKDDFTLFDALAIDIEAAQQLTNVRCAFCCCILL